MTGRSRKVVIIDDDPELCLFLKEFIGALGYQAVLARTLAQGDDAISMIKPPVAVVDMRLPDGGLDEVVALVAKYRNYLRFIAISGFFTPGHVDRLLAAGVRACLPKPLNLDDLRRNLEALMRLYDEAPPPGGRLGPA